MNHKKAFKWLSLVMVLSLLTGCNLPTAENSAHSMDEALLIMMANHRLILGETWMNETGAGQNGLNLLNTQTKPDKINELRLLSRTYAEMATRLEGTSPHVVEYLQTKSNELSQQANRLEKRRNRGTIIRRIGRAFGNIIGGTMDFTSRSVGYLVESEIDRRITELIHTPRNLVKGEILLVIERLAEHRGGQIIRLLTGRTRQNIQRVAYLLATFPETEKISRNLAVLPDINRGLDRFLNPIQKIEKTLEADKDQFLYGVNPTPQPEKGNSLQEQESVNTEVLENLDVNIVIGGFEKCPAPQAYQDILLDLHPPGSVCNWLIKVGSDKLTIEMRTRITETQNETSSGTFDMDFSGEIYGAGVGEITGGEGTGSFQGKIVGGTFTVSNIDQDNYTFDFNGNGDLTLSFKGSYAIYVVFNTTTGIEFSQMEPLTYVTTIPVNFTWQNIPDHKFYLFTDWQDVATNQPQSYLRFDLLVPEESFPD